MENPGSSSSDLSIENDIHDENNNTSLPKLSAPGRYFRETLLHLYKNVATVLALVIHHR
jgi:hypothetical protein